jgi:hypothetical protein
VFYPLILVGAPLFWLLTVGWIVWLLAILDVVDTNDYDDCWSGTKAVLVTGLFVGILCFLGNGSTILPWLAAHWLPAAATYIPAGIITAFVKWFFFCHTDKEALEKVICDWKRQQGLPNPELPVIPSANRKAFLQWLSAQRYSMSHWVDKETDKDGKITYSLVLPSWTKNKSRIAVWMTWWWVVAPWSLVHDFMHHLFRRIMQLFGGWFNAIATWIYSDISSNFVVPADPPVTTTTWVVDASELEKAKEDSKT